MGILATGRSQLTNQVVKVQRRRITRDGMGGASERFDTILERYWVRILPDQHTERGRIEPGEQAVDGSFAALGARTLNGMSIMIGDRFLDEGNNEVYHVKGVKRPVAISSYNVGMVRYQLQIVKDADCGTISESLPGGSAGSSSSSGGGDSGGTHFILRHFHTLSDLTEIREGKFDPGEFDAFVTGFTDGEETTVNNLIADGRRHFQYYELMTFPPPSFHNTWYDWYRTQVQGIWDAGLVNPSGDPGVFRLSPDCQDRQFVDWRKLDAAKRLIIAEMMYSLIPLSSGIFGDQAWLKECPFFFFSEPSTVGGCGACAYCATYASIPSGDWPLFQASIYELYTLIDQIAADRGTWAIKNGEHRTIGTPPQSIPRPIYYEDSANNNLELAPKIESSIAGWRTHPRNVLSVKVPDATSVSRVLDVWQDEGGWIAFTPATGAQTSAVQSAYASAASVRASR